MTEEWWGGEQINDWTKAPFDEVLDEEAGTTGWHTANDSHCKQSDLSGYYSLSRRLLIKKSLRSAQTGS